MYDTQSKLLNKSQEARLENAMNALQEIVDDIKKQTGYATSTFTSVAFINEGEMCELGQGDADTFMVKAKHARHSNVLKNALEAAVVGFLGGDEDDNA